MELRKTTQVFERNENNQVVSKDLLMGTGFGARIFFLYFLLRFDMAWSYNVDAFQNQNFISRSAQIFNKKKAVPESPGQPNFN
jgi:hypothetical protein